MQIRTLSPSGIVNGSHPEPMLRGAVQDCLVAGPGGSVFSALPSLSPMAPSNGLSGLGTSVDSLLHHSLLYPADKVAKALDIAGISIHCSSYNNSLGMIQETEE